MRIDPEVVVALARSAARRAARAAALAREPLEVLGGEIAAVEARPPRRRRAASRRAAAAAARTPRARRRRRGGRGRPSRRTSSRRVVGALLGGDLREAPVRIGAAELVERHAREPARLVHRRTGFARESVTLQPGGRAAYADRRPAPGDVHVVRERDGEPRAPVARRLDAELPAQPLERRVERIETRGRGEEASVPIAAPLRAPRPARGGRTPAASGSPPGSSPRSTASQASARYGSSSPRRTSDAPTMSSTQRARCSTEAGIATARV